MVDELALWTAALEHCPELWVDEIALDLGDRFADHVVHCAIASSSRRLGELCISRRTWLTPIAIIG